MERKAAVVGLGPMGLTHAAITNAVGLARVVAMADTDERLLATGRKILPRVRFFEDYAEMIRAVQPDCVYVCTPPLTHGEVIRGILDAGSPRALFVEKPLATTMQDAESLAHALRGRNVLGMVGFQKRFNGVFEEVNRRIAREEIGRVVLFRAHDFTPGVLGPVTGWRGEPGAGGVTMEWGIHLIDLLLWIFGRPESIEASRRRIFSERVEDYVSASMRFPGGISGFMELGWNMRNYSPPELAIEIHGTKGALHVNEDRLTLYLGADSDHAIGGRTPPVVIHTSKLTRCPPFLLGQPENVWEEVHFQEGVGKGEVSLNTFEDSVRVHEVIDRIRGAPLR
jgi:predicted dehydrogenase